MMQDIDDFDPLDDILLSDEEVPDSKVAVTQLSSLFEKAKESDLDGELQKEKKKKIIAELFGTNEDPKVEDKPITSSVPPSKSDWLELKNDDINDTLLVSATAGNNRNEVAVNDFTSSSERDLKGNSVNLADSNINRRRSAAEKSSDLHKSKQHFKSLDLDLFDFDSSLAPQKASQPLNEGNESKEVETLSKRRESHFDWNDNDSEQDHASSYIPSSNISRRFGLKEITRNIGSERQDWLATLTPDNSKKSYSNVAKDSLPSWLEPKKELPQKPTYPDFLSQNNISNESKEKISSVNKPRDTVATDRAVEGENYIKNEGGSSSIHTLTRQNNDERKDADIRDESGGKYENNVTPSIALLKEKQDQFKELIKNQTETLTSHEQEIHNTAIQLIHRQRDNMKALLQIVSMDGFFNDKKLATNVLRGEGNEEENLENIVSQLQMKLTQQELEKNELEMKLKHAERKHMIDLSMLEDVYKCKLQMTEEKEEYYRKEIQTLENEYDAKLLKRKEEEEELIRSFNIKIKALKEEHINELKHITEIQSLKHPWKFFVNSVDKSEMTPLTDKELVLREIAVEDKQKELLEFEERLNRQKQSLKNKETTLNTRIEDFEMKTTKEKLHLDQQKKDLKLAEGMIEGKQICFERAMQREKEHLISYKQELEIMKDELLKEERVLVKEKFEICAERARLETIMNVEGGGGGRIKDVMQTRADLQGTIDELRSLKTKLEGERNEVKSEKMRLKEESWRLQEIEQELRLQQKNFEKILRESEVKREEGLQALKKAKIVESQFNDKMEEIQKRVLELNRKEDLLTQEKIELSKERDLLTKKKYQLDMVLPQLTYEEKLPFNLLNNNILDPRIMMMKLKTVESMMNNGT